MNENKLFEKKETKGLNVQVRSFYFRHAEKASAIIGSLKTGAISKSAISPRGKTESFQLGIQIPELEKNIKAGWSGNIRTKETLEAKVEGGQSKSYGDISFIEIKELSEKFMPPEWAKLYVAKWDENKRIILAERKISAKRFSILSTGEQAEIAEKAEEPVINEWLNDPKSQLAKLYPPETAAAHVAVLIKKDIEKTKELYSGSKMDQLRGTHKTVLEPFLMHVLILENGQRPKKLEDIGGQFDLNDGFEIDSNTDERGEQSYKFIMYRAVRAKEGGVIYLKKEFKLDMEELDRLADLEAELKNKNETK